MRLSETQITKQIKQVLYRVGALPIKIVGAPYQRPGISDWLVCLDGRFVAIEVKKPGGRITEKQAAFLEDVQRAGGLAFVAYSVDDVIEILGLNVQLNPLFTRERKT